MDYRCDWLQPRKGILAAHLWVSISADESEAIILFTRVRSPASPVLDGPPYVDAPLVRLVGLAQHKKDRVSEGALAGDDISYEPEQGFVNTVYGVWPAPWVLLRALDRNEIAGRATQEALHHIYWFCVCASPRFRAWFAEQYPGFWKAQLTAFPELAVSPAVPQVEGNQNEG